MCITNPVIFRNCGQRYVILIQTGKGGSMKYKHIVFDIDGTLIVVGSFIYDYSRFSAYVNKLLCNIYYILLFSNLFNNIFCILKHMPFIIIL